MTAKSHLTKGALATDAESLAARLQAVEKERDDFRAALAQARRLGKTEEFVRDRIGELLDWRPEPPAWQVEGRDDPGNPGVPVLFLSDLHIGEVIRPGEIQGINAFNLDIAKARLEAVVRIAVELWQRHLGHKQEYDGVVVFLGGDIVSGIIHEELRATNDREIMWQVTEAIELLLSALRLLAAEFGRVEVYCVPGNHGRTTVKPRFKGYAGTSFDWLIYQMLRVATREAADDIVVHVDENRKQLVTVAGTRFLLIHGDQFRGGDGIIGPLGPVTRGDVRQRDQASQLPGEHTYDILALGHHHRAAWMAQLIMNGSLSGFNEYADGNVFRYEPPIQMAWTVHPRHKVTWVTPIYAPPFLELWGDAHGAFAMKEAA